MPTDTTMHPTNKIHVDPKPTEMSGSGWYNIFTELDSIAVYLGQEPGTPVSLENISRLLRDDKMGLAIASGRSELVERNLGKMDWTCIGDKFGHEIMRDMRAHWPSAAFEMTAEFMMSLWVMNDLERWVRDATEEAKGRRRAALDAETASTGRPLTVDRARQFIAKELDLSMRETIRRTTGFKADQILALAA